LDRQILQLFVLKFDAVDFYKFVFIVPIFKLAYKLERNAVDNLVHSVMEYSCSLVARWVSSPPPQLEHDLCPWT
jgi:hypothetical protein